ncbi:LysM peptidoglycan-binding domain-containing protein [Peribacillus glennii]|uniref:LysM peptidoglycan-binding domain-containing protein n=1 Tax=Peribacillus glennii TaxID=2303991 RepID=A0A372LIT7_9BACI|nr:LysM peptidoglycan-binding domain-containing protein [Peribacillus glennii]RFU65894.1 LysM peptidoglycan-binding domain-containing protein [Peribacillus glennii]
MSKENQSYLRFSLEESIWFQKEHEVAELYSISLDPNVTILERDQYVVIKGTLDLSGEYKEDRGTGESVIKNYTQHYHPKTVQQVERRDSGINEFMHRFPVDITIPYDRIHSLQDVDVEIQTFDYLMPDKNCLKLQADLLITGIYRDQLSDQEVDDETYGEESQYGYGEHEEVSYESNFTDYSASHQDLDEPTTHREKETNPAGGETEIFSQTEQGQFETFEEYIRKTSSFQSLKGEEDNQKFEAMFESPIIAGESPVSNTEDGLYIPFYAQARKLPEEGRAEKSEPELISKQPDIPVFDIPMEPLYDELKTKMQVSEKQPETTHPWTDLIKHGSFDPDETNSVQQEPAPAQQPATGQQVPLPAQQPATGQQQQPIPAQQPAESQKPLLPAGNQPAGQQAPRAAEQEGDRGEKQKVQAEQTQLEQTKPEPIPADDGVQKPEQQEPLPDNKQANQEEPILQEPVQNSKGIEEEPVPAETNQQSGRKETEPAKAEAEPGENQLEPILHLAKREDAPKVKNAKNKDGRASSNRESEPENQEQKEHISLMDFFGRKQEEELTKVKVCIVQHGDTLSSLADRYEVSEQSILSSNALEQGQDVYEGQVLYIPRGKALKL